MTSPTLSTPERLITDAMFDAGLLQEGGTPNSEQFAMYTRRLEDVINFEQTQGLKLWTQSDQEVVLVSGQRDYTLAPSGDVDIVRPLRVLQGYYLDQDDNRRPIYPLSWDEWMRLATTVQEGPITQFFVQKQVTQLLVSFWLVPDDTAATGTVHLLLQNQIVNFTNLYEDIDFPIEWYMFLRWALADEICSGQPQAIMDRCAQRSQAYRMRLEDWDVEDVPTRFEVDASQGAYGHNRFR